MKQLLANTFLLLGMTILTVAQDNPVSQPKCSLIDSTTGSIYITFERLEKFQVRSSGDEPSDVLLRLHNNSDCTVLINTLEAEKFIISRSAPFSPKNIRWDFNDGEFVPGLTFFVQDNRKGKAPVSVAGGDFSFVFNLLGGRSILFAVPVKYLRKGYDIVIPFEYAWEKEGSRYKVFRSGSVNHSIDFMGDSLPAEVRKQIGRF